MATSEQPPAWYLTPPPGKTHDYRVHPKQRAVLESDARHKTLKWGRRAGKNGVATIEALEFCRDPASKPYGRDDPTSVPDDAPIEVWWVSRSYDQAEKHGFEKVKAAAWDSWIADQSRSPPYWIEFENGVRIEFRTFDHPDTLQGAGVDGLIVDERDYMPDSVWYSDLDPMTLDYRAWTMWISKPLRQDSLFQRWFEMGQDPAHPDHFSSHATSADNPFIAEDPEDKRDQYPDFEFRREYLAELPDDSGQVFGDLAPIFSGEYEVTAELDDRECGTVERAKPGHATVTDRLGVGIDLARHRDFRVSIVLNEHGELLHYSREQNEAWDAIFDDVLDLAGRWDAETVVVPDATRDNKLIADIAAEGVPIHPINFSPKRKKTLIEDLVTQAESGGLALPDHPSMREPRKELRNLKREVKDSGYTSYHAPENEHDDIVDALALANAGLYLEPVNADERVSELPWG